MSNDSTNSLLQLEYQMQTTEDTQAPEELSIEKTNAHVEQILQESLKSVYLSTRLANEISGLENKMHSLLSIRQTLLRDSNKPQAGLQSMDTTIKDLESQIEKKKIEMAAAEKHVVQGFQDITKHILEDSALRANSISKGFLVALEKFGSQVKNHCNEQISRLDREIELLKNSKLDANEKDSIVKNIDTIKSDLVDVQRKSFKTMHNATLEHFQKMNQRMEESIARVQPDVIKNEVEEKIVSSMDGKFKEYLEKAKQQNALMMAQQQNVPDKVAELVKKEVMDQVGPARLQNIITSLPEFQALKEMRDTMPTANVTMPDFDSVKSVMNNLSSELVDLKQRTNSTRAIVDTLRTQGLPTNESNAIEFDQTAALKHMEEMERDVSMIHNSIKMIEAVISVKSKAVDDAVSGETSNLKKRPRSEDAVTGSVADGEISNNVILAKLNDIETKHQKLIDFIFQCKDTVLDDMFPTRLEAAMKKIERVLLNHETFISYIIDPFSTSKRTLAIPAEPLSSPAETSASNDFSSLNPAMLDAISQLVKKTAEELSLPLQKKIKLLEEKLETRQP